MIPLLQAQRSLEESKGVSGVPQVLFQTLAGARMGTNCAPSSELSSGLLLRGCAEHRGTGTLLGSMGSAAQEGSGCPGTKTSQNPQGAEP